MELEILIIKTPCLDIVEQYNVSGPFFGVVFSVWVFFTPRNTQQNYFGFPTR